MLKEVAHFLRHSPATLRLRARMNAAELYHHVVAQAEKRGMAGWRRSAIEGITGEVLELGSGTGVMFPHYPSCARVTGIEPDTSYLALSDEAARREGIRIVRASGEDLPFAADRFDSVVSVLVLCSVPAMRSVLAELRRVLKPGGELRLIEHVRSERAVAGARPRTRSGSG